MKNTKIPILVFIATNLLIAVAMLLSIHGALVRDKYFYTSGLIVLPILISVAFTALRICGVGDYKETSFLYGAPLTVMSTFIGLVMLAGVTPYPTWNTFEDYRVMQAVTISFFIPALIYTLVLVLEGENWLTRSSTKP